MAQSPNRGSLSVTDVMQGATVLIKAGQFNKIGEVVCPAGLNKFIGYGVSSSQADAEGRIFANLRDTVNGAIKGKLRISVFSPQDRSLTVVDEWPTAALNSSETDRTKQIPLPQKMLHGIGKDFKFVFEVNPTADCEMSRANTVINIDTTEQLLH